MRPMKLDPRIAVAFRREFSDWRLWLARAIVITVAAAAGLTVVGFTWLTERALETFSSMRSTWWWAPLLWTPLCTGTIVWLTRRYVPGAAGSGIPQVMAALDSSVDGGTRGLFVSIKLTLAVIGVITNGATFGSGYAYTRAMLEGQEHVSAAYVLFKFIATWLTAWSGVPAGIFAPSLAIGAALGNDVAQLTSYPHASTLIALGMAGFLAAATQAPLTSFIIVMEMVDGHAMVLSLMACALIASGISRILSRPLYATLAQIQLRRLPPPKAESKTPAPGL